jgi:exosome complex RNA-binding protein Rrp4
MGELKDGYIFWIPQYKHQIIQNNLLEKLGKCVKFEVAFSKNGRIWINSAKLDNIMLISNMFKLIANKLEE